MKKAAQPLSQTSHYDRLLKRRLAEEINEDKMCRPVALRHFQDEKRNIHVAKEKSFIIIDDQKTGRQVR